MHHRQIGDDESVFGEDEVAVLVWPCHTFCHEGDYEIVAVGLVVGHLGQRLADGSA